MIILPIIYFVFITSFLFSFRKKVISSKRQETHATVIVAAHNEEASIHLLLDSFLKQDHPLEAVEFIVANDRSIDKTGEILLRYKPRFPNFKIITITTLPEGKFGKKNALEHAIESATHDVLLFTDADCECSENWISSTLELYEEDTASVVGNSPLTPVKDSFIEQFQIAETLFAHIIAYVSIQFKSPVMSFGRNFSYRKSVFEKIDGFKSIEQSMSGDDDLLLDQIRKHKLPVKYNKKAQVPSPPMLTFASFLRQRTRHLSAVKYFSMSYQIMASLFHLSHIGVYASLFFIDHPFFVLGTKLFLDGLVFWKMNQIYKSNRLIRYFFLWECFYLPYVFILTIKGYFAQMKSIKW